MCVSVVGSMKQWEPLQPDFVHVHFSRSLRQFSIFSLFAGYTGGFCEMDRSDESSRQIPAYTYILFALLLPCPVFIGIIFLVLLIHIINSPKFLNRKIHNVGLF